MKKLVPFLLTATMVFTMTTGALAQTKNCEVYVSNCINNNCNNSCVDNNNDGIITGSEASYIAEVVRLVNVERTKSGLSKLSIDNKAVKAANIRSKEQVQSFSHTRPNGSSFSTALTEAGVLYNRSGENIAYGQKTPAQVMDSWMNSDGHRANILNKNFTSIGVGCYKSGNTYYWTQLFIG